MSEKIVVGLSGGVDSSVAAYLLKEQGYEVLGVFMKNWEEDDGSGYCSIKQDSLDAISVADWLGIDIELVNFAAQYKSRVFEYFLSEYQAGRTPNPDILCNSEIKFRCFLDYAIEQGSTQIATGHYANIRHRKDGSFELLRGHDSGKDQSYFLYALKQEQIARALFPLGQIAKSEVRQIAEQIGLPNARKKDSTGICFIGERPFREFLSQYFPKQSGLMVTPNGQVVGEHIGLMYYTIGQRQGLHIGGPGKPWFVADKNIEKNELIVVQGRDHPLLLRFELMAQQLSWLQDSPIQWGHYTAKIRYRQEDARCQITYLDENCCRIRFDEAQWAVTPGQSVVLYDQAVCLGGGIITLETPSSRCL